MKLYCDNKIAINIAHNTIQHDKIKHIEIDRHFMKEKLEVGEICFFFYNATDNKHPNQGSLKV